MKRYIFVLLLALALLISWSSAADLTMSTGQKDYYFTVGETAKIPINISNTNDHALQGIIRATATESTQGPGLSMSSSYSQSQSYMAPAGDSIITIDGGTSAVEKSLAFSIYFDYNDPSPKSQVLEDITLHFVKDPSQEKNSLQNVVSRASTPNQRGTGLSSNPYQSIQQIMQQVSGINPQQSPQKNQMTQDTQALKQQLEAEQNKTQSENNEFLKNLNYDPTFSAVNQSLISQGYSSPKIDVNAQTGEKGTFSTVYSKTNGESVLVKGSLQNGTSPEITEQSSGPVLPPGPFTQNESYQKLSIGLENEGYKKFETRIKNTLTGITINQSYKNTEGKAAYLNATSSGMNVTSVKVQKEKVEANYVFPIVLAVIISILALIGFLIYRKPRERQKPPSSSNPIKSVPRVVDYRKEAELLLEEAEKLAEQRRYPQAFGTAGQALRLFLSYRFDGGTEMTNAEVISLLAGSRKEIQSVQHLLERCSLVEFAKEDPEPGEFEQFVTIIRKIFKEE